MKFAQLIEFRTSQIDAFNANLDAWMAKTDGRRIPHRAVLRRDQESEDLYLLMVEFASYDAGMENSSRPETGEFAAFLASICESPPAFRNLDVLREEDL
jgi:quinol monooxygenase YgiN